MNGLDLACLLASGAAAVGGWRQGIVVRIVTSCGSIAGVLLAASNVDWIAKHLPAAQRTPRLVAVLLSLAVGWIAGRWIGAIAGRWFRRRIPTRALQKFDRLAGSMAGLLGVAVTLWLAAPVMKLLPGWPSRVVQGSVVTKALDRTAGVAPLPIDTDLWSSYQQRGQQRGQKKKADPKVRP